MGRKPRIMPERLPDKLRRIRVALGLSQSEMWRRLGAEDLIWSKQISTYELGTNEPPLTILLKYARLAGVSTDVLIDDELDLPANLPSPTKSEGVRRKSASRAKKGSKR
ncbi:MAG TPA: helix-turn-helix transcriptional regulator [Pyrinomonadaceae bacterium]|nr:helix-turn-helix transcriptional regulator [Pyrinomonadaceae bacterium]